MKKKSPVKGFKVKPKKKTYTKKAGTKPTGKYTKKAGTLSSPGSVVKDSPEMRKRKIDKLKADPRINVRLGKVMREKYQKAPMKITAKQKANLPANLVKEIKAKEASGMKMKKAAMKLKKESAMMLKKSAMEMKKASAMKMKMKKSAATMKKAAMKMKMKRK